MSIVAVAGDGATTTAVALASARPAGQDTLLVEADATGGDVAAWFDMPVAPSLSTVVTTARGGAWPQIERHVREVAGGLRVVPCSAGAAEASRSVAESGRAVVGTLGALRSPITIADVGRPDPTPAAHPFVAASSVTVVVHRQATQSARAAAVRLQRLADQIDALSGLATVPIVAIVGRAPFGLGEIGSFLAGGAGPMRVVGLPVDELTAAVLAGRSGVSAKRLARLPLMRASRDLATLVEAALDEHVVVSQGAAG